MHRPLPARGPKPPNPAEGNTDRAKSNPEKVVNPPKRSERQKGPYTAGPKK